MSNSLQHLPFLVINMKRDNLNLPISVCIAALLVIRALPVKSQIDFQSDSSNSHDEKYPEQVGMYIRIESLST